MSAKSINLIKFLKGTLVVLLLGLSFEVGMYSGLSIGGSHKKHETIRIPVRPKMNLVAME